MDKTKDILAWIRTISIVGVFVIMLVCALKIVPKVETVAARADQTFNEVDSAMTELKKTADLLETEIPNMSSSVQTTMKNVEKDLTCALESFSSIDFNDLNDAIGDL